MKKMIERNFASLILTNKSARALQRVVHIHRGVVVVHQSSRLCNASCAGILQQKLSCPVHELIV
jgi:hypothetical protein